LEGAKTVAEATTQVTIADTTPPAIRELRSLGYHVERLSAPSGSPA
jgi:hypothetical protein